MCGIAGHYAYSNHAQPVDRNALLRTRDSMSARGPDGAGIWFSDDGKLGLAHRRLAIIDLTEAGAQPMQSPDGRYVVTFNGEIYNYPALRAVLEKEGVVFRSHSDTEVLLHLYRRDGPAMVERLRGMFAFGLWDAQERSLFLARDPHGIKPLYYADDGKTLRFASQVAALKAGGGVDLGPDPAGTAGFLLWGSVPEPFTLHRGIRLLNAGSTLRVTPDGVSPQRRYWSVSSALQGAIQNADSVPRGKERDFLRAELLDSVNAHLLADVPVGAFLSAGLDSSTLVGLAREAVRAPLQTLTLSFDDFAGTHNDECPMASEIAQHLDVAHRCVVLPAGELDHELDRFFAAMDQPTIDGINTWLVSRAATEAGLKVALSGLGGDELLGGYSSFEHVPALVQQARRSPWRHVGSLYTSMHSRMGAWFRWPPEAAGLFQEGGTPAGAYHLDKGVFMPWELRHVMDRDAAAAGMRFLAEEDHANQESLDGFDAFQQVMLLESARYMRNQLLRDTDWVSMAHSLEIRVPMVDSHLTSAIAGLAALGRLGKSDLPETLTRSLPESVCNRPKTGFTTPTWRWLRHHPDLGAWRSVPFLRQTRVRDPRRWAYTLLHRIPEARTILKRQSNG